MGGQACVFYGAAQFSKDIDFVLLADEENFSRLQAAMEELSASRIAVPRFDPAVLARGHAVHFRCQAAGVEGLRVDVMTRLRELDGFSDLWARRTTFMLEEGQEFHLLSIEDLVEAKKTQRSRDWPTIEALVEGHYKALDREPTSARIEFWLRESRTPERLREVVGRFPTEALKMISKRPLLADAVSGDLDALRVALDAEVRAEQEKDRIYWAPLRRELEEFRRLERDQAAG